MSARWALLIVLLLAAYGARADIGIKRSFTPVVPVGPLVEERVIEPSDNEEEATEPVRKINSASDSDQEVIFNKRARNLRVEELNQIELDEEGP